MHFRQFATAPALLLPMSFRHERLGEFQQLEARPVHLEGGQGRIVASEDAFSTMQRLSGRHAVKEVDDAAVCDGESPPARRTTGLLQPLQYPGQVLCAAFTSWNDIVGIQAVEGSKRFTVEGRTANGCEALKVPQTSLAQPGLEYPAAYPESRSCIDATAEWTDMYPIIATGLELHGAERCLLFRQKRLVFRVVESMRQIASCKTMANAVQDHVLSAGSLPCLRQG
jgi:hypothetical protein